MRLPLILAVLCTIAARLSVAAQQPRIDPSVDETTAIMIAAARLIRLELPSDSVLVYAGDGTAGAAARGRAVRRRSTLGRGKSPFGAAAHGCRAPVIWSARSEAS